MLKGQDPVTRRNFPVQPLNLVLSLAFFASGTAGILAACSSNEGNGRERILDGGDGAGGSAGSGGSRFDTDSGRPSGRSPLGTPCLEDVDCPQSGLVCLAQGGSDFLGGGPSNGMCAYPCATTTECRDIDPSAVCVLIDDGGTPRDGTDDIAFCFAGCTLGPIEPGGVKCDGRLDVACVPRAAGTSEGYCQPACTGDSDCGARVCDLSLGVCVDAEDRQQGSPIGAECNLDEDCAGICLPLTDTSSVCSGICSMGVAGCGAEPGTSALDAFCLLSPQAHDEGDLGYCSQLCDCNEDCLHPDMICEAVGGLDRAAGRLGFCFPREFSDDGIGIPCSSPPPQDGGSLPEAGAD